MGLSLILNSYFRGYYFNKEFCQLPAQYQVIESDHFFILVFSCYNFPFKEDTSKGP